MSSSGSGWKSRRSAGILLSLALLIASTLACATFRSPGDPAPTRPPTGTFTREALVTVTPSPPVQTTIAPSLTFTPTLTATPTASFSPTPSPSAAATFRR